MLGPSVFESLSRAAVIGITKADRILRGPKEAVKTTI